LLFLNTLLKYTTKCDIWHWIMWKALEID